jgi:hypothetical protein
MPIKENDYLKYLIEEYRSLSGRLDSYTQSSFEDFKLLAVSGLVLAWPPLTKQLATTSDPFTLFIGFTVILVAVAAIDARDNLKHSIIRFHMDEARKMENEISKLVGIENAAAFCIAKNWEKWFDKKHRILVAVFQSLAYSITVLVPAATLIYKAWGAQMSWIYVAAYAAVLILVAIVMTRSIFVLRS